MTRWAKDIRDDVWDRALFNRGTLGGAFGIAAAMLVFGPGWGLLLALSHLILYVFVLAPSINGLGHWWPAQQSSHPPLESKVQDGPLRVRSLVGGDPGAGAPSARTPGGRSGAGGPVGEHQPGSWSA